MTCIATLNYMFLCNFCLVFFYGSETWWVTLREEHRLRMFENRVLMNIFWHKRDEITDE